MSVLRLYGRQRLRGIKKETLLFFDNHYSVLKFNPDSNPPKNLWLEVGSGYGEHVICQAISNPNRHYIACEPFLNGMIATLQKILEHNLSNVSLHYGDARHVLNALPQDALDGLYLLFPDPWPKTRHAKRRFVQREMLEKIHGLLKLGGEWKIATDHPIYKEWVHHIIESQSCFKKETFFDDRIITRYQEWAVSEGREIEYFLLRKY
jgi:tRNA (guanine-N7-)-methyltransferase